MSTILKALEQLERDEEGADPAARSAATPAAPTGDPEVALPPIRRRRRRSPFGRGVALAVVLALGFTALAWLGLQSRLAPVGPSAEMADTAETVEMAAAVEAPSRVPAPRVPVPSKRQARPAAEPAGDALAAAPRTGPGGPVVPPATVEAVAPPAPEPVAPAPEPSTAGGTSAPTPVAAVTAPESRRTVPESRLPVASPESAPEPPAAEVSPESAPPAPDVRVAADTPADEPERAAREEPKPEPAVVTPAAATRAESVVDIALAGDEPPERLRPVAPRWTLERTRWHPAPEKRAASLRVDGLDRVVREGDDLEGYQVAEIKPSSIVLERDGEEIVVRVGGR